VRVLLDENIDRFLKAGFDPVVEVLTVAERGWKGMRNGALLRAAQSEFDVCVTMDKNLEYQQNLRAINMGFVVIHARSNSYQDVEPLMPQVNEAIKRVRPGEVVHVTASSPTAPIDAG
jgi:hypothetical protein